MARHTVLNTIFYVGIPAIIYIMWFFATLNDVDYSTIWRMYYTMYGVPMINAIKSAWAIISSFFCIIGVFMGVWIMYDDMGQLMSDIGKWCGDMMYNIIALSKYLIFVFAVYRLITLITGIISSELRRGKYGDVSCKCYCGTPGTGKTYSALDECVYLAKIKWRELCNKYHTLNALYPSLCMDQNTAKIAEYQSIKRSYDFFKRSEKTHIPCLATSIPVCDNAGRMSYVANIDFAEQHSVVADYCVIFYDEWGASQGRDTSTGSPATFIDFYRHFRHYGDFTIIGTEQAANIGLYARNVLDYFIHLTKCKWVLKPKFLLFLLSIIKWIRDLMFEHGADVTAISRWIYYVNNIVCTIGFRRIKYRLVTTDTVGGSSTIMKRGHYMMYSRSDWQYNDHCNKWLYDAYYYNLDPEILQSHGINITDAQWESYNAGNPLVLDDDQKSLVFLYGLCRDIDLQKWDSLLVDPSHSMIDHRYSYHSGGDKNNSETKTKKQ